MVSVERGTWRARAALLKGLTMGAFGVFVGGRTSFAAINGAVPEPIGNVAVVLAALGVFGTGSVWPDLFVAAIMAALALTASVTVVGHSLRELGYETAAQV
jgi:hypothetical protein